MAMIYGLACLGSILEVIYYKFIKRDLSQGKIKELLTKKLKI